MDAALHLADGFKIVIDLGTVRWAKLAIQARDVLVETVEQAGFLAQRGLSLCHAAAFTE